MRPLAGSPRGDLGQVRAEVHRLQLVVNELPNVPRQVIVTENLMLNRVGKGVGLC